MNEEKSLLIVDDDDDILESLKTVFDHSFQVITAKDGKAALDLFSNYKARMSAVITDCVIPLIDGAALIEEIRKTSQVPILALSGVDSMYLLKSLKSGATGVLSKPFTRFEIEFKLQSILNR